MPKKINIGNNELPTVADFEKHFGEMSGGGKVFDKAGETILKGTDFLANIFGMKVPLEKEDQAQLNLLIQRKKEAKQLAEDKALGRDTQERIANMQIKAKQASDNATRAQLASQAAAELRENRRYHNNVAPPRIWKILQGVLEPFWRNAAPYVVLAIVLVVLIMVLKNSLGRSRSRPANAPRFNFGNPIAKLKRAARNTKNFLIKEEHYIIRKIKKIFANIAKFFEKLLHPLYKLRQVTNIASGGAHDTAYERIKIESGRCDNMKWVETTDEGKKGYCDNAVHPIDLTWKIDNTKTPDYFDLPASRKSQIDKYSTVKIPWDVNPEASFYVPQCEKAYYPQTCKSNGICEKADMFEDLGLTCKPKDDKLPTQYPVTEDKPATSFDDTENKKCIDLHTLADVPC